MYSYSIIFNVFVFRGPKIKIIWILGDINISQIGTSMVESVHVGSTMYSENCSYFILIGSVFICWHKRKGPNTLK